MKIFKSFFTLLFFALTCWLFSPNSIQAQKKDSNGLSNPSATSQPQHSQVASMLVSGRNVKYVEFGRNGKILGAYKQLEGKTWIEIGVAKGASNFKFEETKRDMWSVHLKDVSRSTYIQLDLKNKKIMYGGAENQAKRPLYDLMNPTVKAPDRDIREPDGKPSMKPVKGENVTLVDYGRNGNKLGYFIQTGKNTWKEVGEVKGAGTFEFKELNRDEWSVYLKDESRNVSIQLDLHTKKVMYKDGRNPQERALYEILKSSDKINAWLVQEVYFENNQGAKGKFMQKDGKGWVEVDESGKTTFSFFEKQRDDWSVYLYDKSRNAQVQLDLHTRLVMFAAAEQKRYPIYKIVDVKASKSTPPIIPPSIPEAFTHTTNSGNTAGNSTWLNHSKTNNNPNAIVFVTPNWKSPYNPTSIGVYWHGDKWRIFNQDRSKAIPENYRFNVLAYPHVGNNVFVHISAKETIPSTQKHITRIDHPYCNGDKNAKLIVTQNYGTNAKGVYNDHPIGVYYANGHWTIFNQDRAPIPENARFNVLILKDYKDAGINNGARVLNHIVSFESTKRYPHVSLIDNVVLNGKSNLLLFTTSSWNTSTYNNHNSGVYYHSGKWSIYNCDKKAMPEKAFFNILAIDPDKGNTQVVPNSNNKSLRKYNGRSVPTKTKKNN